MKTATERFWQKVKKTDSCWLWTAALDKGYGVFGATPTKRTTRAHRFSYELENGPIPAGLELDHLCRVRHCVNPAHLEAVTKAENTRRGLRGVLFTHCCRGHEYAGKLAYNGRRICSACKREWWHKTKHKRKRVQ